jgi:hypothetical protein
MADVNSFVGSKWFSEILENEASVAKASDEFFPAVQVFRSPGLAVRLIDLSRNWSGLVVLHTNHKLLPFIAMTDLQTRRLFVLTDVSSVVSQNSSDLIVYSSQGWHIASTYGLVHDIECGISQAGEVIHRCLHCSHTQSSTFCFLNVSPQHLVAQIHDRYSGPGRGVQNRLPTASGCQAQNV